MMNNNSMMMVLRVWEERISVVVGFVRSVVEYNLGSNCSSGGCVIVVHRFVCLGRVLGQVNVCGGL